MSWKYWENLCFDLLSHVKTLRSGYRYEASDAPDVDGGESPAYEVLKFEDPEGYFACECFPPCINH